MPKGKRTNQLVLKTDNDEIELKKFKSIYYLFNAKPDTRVKILEENRKVSKTDILELNQQIIEKLKIYKVVTAMATIKLSLSDKMTLDFSNWTEFTNENFNYSSFVDLIDIDWDFYLKLPGYK